MTGGAKRWKRATVDEVAPRVLRDLVTQLLRRADSLQKGLDPERTHRLRVSVRRLRVALRAFEPRLAALDVSRIMADLRWLFGRLGAVREYDVLLDDKGTAPLGDADDGMRDLARELERRRGRAEREVRRALSSKRTAKLFESLRSLPAAIGEIEHEHASPGFGKWARKRLDKRLDKVRALRGGARAGTDPELRHQLRKEIKKLRYLSDLFAPRWSRKQVGAYVARIGDLQDVLGELNDAVVSAQLLDDAAQSAEGNAGAAARSWRRAEERSAEREQERLERRFRKFEKARPFWRD